MATKITRQILEAYLNCKTKAHLKLAGQQGNVSDYEAMLISNRHDVRQQAIDKILARTPESEVVRDVPLTAATLRAGSSFVLNATLEDDLLSVSFDGLKRVDGPSKLGAFHYVPMLFHESRKVGKEQRLLLDLYGLLLSQIQERFPAYGLIWHGKECRTTRMRLNDDLRKTERLLREVKEMVSGESPPKLILNDHCQVCEFRQRCHDQAVQEDNISLLRSLSVKEIKNYARKGILTVAQLAHTFRPRRKPKRAAQSSAKRYHALQALAIRDKRIYVFGAPELTVCPVAIYLDIESAFDHGSVYLIGLIVVDDRSETRYSLWADNQCQETHIFEQFMTIVSRHDDYHMFCYGSHEKAFLKRMSRLMTDRTDIDKLLTRLVNVLSLIYDYIYFPTFFNGLKDIGKYLGCSWTERDASGVLSMVWRSRWESTGDDVWKTTLLTYNLEDCAGLKKVTDLLFTIASKSRSELGPLTLGTETISVSSVQDIEKLTQNRKWGKVAFYHAEYTEINNCAYFNYQRDRVYIRTSRTLRKSMAILATKHNRRLRITKRFQILASTCESDHDN
jgi:predicted RecB family nuclease